jgi:hypothetical protein
MQVWKTSVAVYVAALFVLGLTACGQLSGEPSASDVEKAVRSTFEQVNKQSQGFLDIKIREIKKVACATVPGSSGFNCDVEIDAGEGKRIQQFRFVKGSDGWVMVLPN